MTPRDEFNRGQAFSEAMDCRSTVVFAYGRAVCKFIGHHLCPLPFAWNETEIMVEEGFEMLGTIMVLRGCTGELNRLRSTRRDLF